METYGIGTRIRLSLCGLCALFTICNLSIPKWIYKSAMLTITDATYPGGPLVRSSRTRGLRQILCKIWWKILHLLRKRYYNAVVILRNKSAVWLNELARRSFSFPGKLYITSFVCRLNTKKLFWVKKIYSMRCGRHLFIRLHTKSPNYFPPNIACL